MRVVMVGLIAFLSLAQAARAGSGAEHALQEGEAPPAAEKPAKKMAKKAAEKPAAAKAAVAGKAGDRQKKPAAEPAIKAGEPLPAADALACPESITVEAQKLKGAARGFEPFNEDATYWLETVHIYTGDKKIERMEPYKNTESSSLWRLLDNGRQHYYLVCSYRDTSVALKKRLPAGLSDCHVAPKSNPQNPRGPQVLHHFECQ